MMRKEELDQGECGDINDVATTIIYKILNNNNKCLSNWKVGNKDD